MYITQEIADRIKFQIKRSNKSLKIMLGDLNLGINAISEFSKGKQLSCISLARIADYLDCSVDYLLGRTDLPNTKIENVQYSNVINGNNGDNSPLNVSEHDNRDEMSEELLKKFNALSFDDKIDVFNYIKNKGEMI